METLHTENYKGYTINIVPDDDMSDLSENVTGDLLVCLKSRDVSGFGYDSAIEYLNNKLKKLSAKQVYARMNTEIKEYIKDTIKYSSSYTGVYDYLDYTSYADWTDDYTELQVLQILCDITKTQYCHYSVHGYCQSDYAEVVYIDNGNFADFYNTAQKQKEYIEACFYGGFISAEIQKDGEHVEWLCGHLEESEAIDEAKSTIDKLYIDDLRKHEQHTKTMIKNRVPILMLWSVKSLLGLCGLYVSGFTIASNVPGLFGL